MSKKRFVHVFIRFPIFLISLQKQPVSHKKMKRILLMAAVAMMTVLVQAQKIEVVDAEGHGIPLVSVLTEDGNLIGTTDLNGVINDVKGAAKVAVTHVAFQPQLVSIASLNNGRITMEALDYELQEIVVKPKPYIYVETYYRAYAFINDSLRYYQAGILPNAYNIQKQDVETGSYSSAMGYFSPSFGVSITWGARVEEYHAGKIHTSIDKKMQPDGEGSKKYFTTLTDDGPGRQRVSNPEGTVGYIITANGQCQTTLDGAKMQMYRNKALGQEKQLKRREKKEYDYQFTEIFNIDEDGNSSMTDFVMYSHHWEWNGSKGRMKFIIETYATERSYVDKEEWKAKKKELKDEHKNMMSLNQLEAYATDHGIPALTPVMRQAIENLGKK